MAERKHKHTQTSLWNVPIRKNRHRVKWQTKKKEAKCVGIGVEGCLTWQYSLNRVIFTTHWRICAWKKKCLWKSLDLGISVDGHELVNSVNERIEKNNFFKSSFYRSTSTRKIWGAFWATFLNKPLRFDEFQTQIWLSILPMASVFSSSALMALSWEWLVCLIGRSFCLVPRHALGTNGLG